MVNKITPEIEAELDRLNRAVDAAIEEREKWLDKMMVELSDLKVGDPIYDIRKGERLGVVHTLYRYHTDQNKLYDRSLSWDYRYETLPNCLDNTSRQFGVFFGTREEAIKYQEDKIDRLRNPQEIIDMTARLLPNGDVAFLDLLRGAQDEAG